jgi:hypothetical protein
MSMTVNDFPPILSHLGTQVGKKDELILVIPKTSKLYYIFTKEEDTYKNNTNQFINSLKSLIAYEDIEEHITSIEKNETSITVIINLKHIKYQTITVGDDYNSKNPFVFEYTIGHGYVINIQMITIRYTQDDIVELYQETKQLVKKCKDALIRIGYTSHFYSSKYKNDKNIVQVWIRPEKISCTLTLSIYEKYVYKNYNNLDKLMKENNLDKQYQILDTILK